MHLNENTGSICVNALVLMFFLYVLALQVLFW